MIHQRCAVLQNSKPKRTLKFYSKEEDDEIIRQLGEFSETNTFRQIYQNLGKQLNRNPIAIEQHVHGLKKIIPNIPGRKDKPLKVKPTKIEKVKIKETKIKKVKVKKIKVVTPEKGIPFPKGFEFRGTPKEVILFADHFRVYF